MNNLFNIYHPLEGAINNRCERGLYQYEHVATIEAASLEDAFKQGQNNFNSEYSELGFRSTCIGDIITQSDESGIVEHYMVDSIGFIQIPETVLSYMDSGLSEIYGNWMAEQMLDNPEDYGLI